MGRSACQQPLLLLLYRCHDLPQPCQRWRVSKVNRSIVVDDRDPRVEEEHGERSWIVLNPWRMLTIPINRIRPLSGRRTNRGEAWRALKKRAWIRGAMEAWMEEGNGARSNGIKLVGRCCYVSPRDDETKRRDSVKEKGVVESFLPLTAFHRSRTSVFYIYTYIYI